MFRRFFYIARFQGLPRVVFATGAGLAALALAIANEVTVDHHARAETLLFPTIVAPTPTLTRVEPPPVPTSTIPTPTPQEHTYDFVVELQIPAPGLQLTDFAAVDEAGNLRYKVIKADYVSSVTRQQNTNGMDVMMLFDQSGSIHESDPQNQRVPAGQDFVNMLPANVRVAVGSFPSSGLFGQGDLQVNQDFTEDHTPLRNTIGSFAGREGGGTPLTASIRAAIQKLADAPADRSRLLLCFVDGIDGDIQNLDTRTALIRDAKKAKIKVSFVTLGLPDQMAVQTLEEISTATGGQIEAVTDATRLRTAFKNFASDVLKDRSYYRLTIQAKRSSPFMTGETLRARITAQNKAQSFQLTLK